jgi:uncharacterized protein YukE
VRASGDDMTALSGQVRRRLRDSLNTSDEVATTHHGFDSADELKSCAHAWEDRMISLARTLGELGERLRDSADSYENNDQESADRMQHALKALEGK